MSQLAINTPYVKATHVIAIDPGLQGTGYAAFDHGRLVDVTVFSTPSAERDRDWWERGASIAEKVLALALVHFRDVPRSRCLVVSEYPQHFGTAGSSMGFKTGDLVRLAHLVGTIHGTTSGRANFFPVEVNTWKGQLPKALVTERLQQSIGKQLCAELGVTSHAWDAVGIGMWALGKF
jgi:hypothetical protein